MTDLTEDDEFDLLLDDEWDVEPGDDGDIRDPEAILARPWASCWPPSLSRYGRPVRYLVIIYSRACSPRPGLGCNALPYAPQSTAVTAPALCMAMVWPE
jgi:hypothetical protein